MTGPSKNHARSPKIESGTLDVFHATDAGWEIDLAAISAGLAESPPGEDGIRLSKELPHLSLTPTPLVLTLEETDNLSLANFPPVDKTTCVVTDFGALSLRIRLRLNGLDLEEIRTLSTRIADEQVLITYADQLTRRVLEKIEPAVTRPFIGRNEQYQVFHFKEVEQGSPIELVGSHRPSLAHILRAEMGKLHEEQIEDALKLAISYFEGDRALIDTRAAVLLGNADFRDVQTVLAFATVELLELRVLDDLLNERLTEPVKTDQLLPPTTRSMPRRQFNLQQLETLETEAAIQFNRITNPLRLFDDHFLADVYRLAAERFGLKHWAEEVDNNLAILRTITENLTEEKKHRRSLLLETAVLLVIIYEAFHLDIPSALLKWFGGS